jgi:hypothetical protein
MPSEVDGKNGLNMRISPADSRAKGFKKWSDAQRPSHRLHAADDQGAQHQIGDPTRAGISTVEDGK